MTGIKQLARHLNMSISTVSRALNDSPEASAETKALVSDAATRLGYFPNQSGRSLRRGSTGAVGFMVQTGLDMAGRGDLFFMDIFDGVHDMLSRHDLDLVALMCSSSQNPDDYLRRMVSRGFVDGVIISYTMRVDRRIEMLAAHGLPFVTLGRSTTDLGQSWLDADLETVANVAIGRLAGKGHKRIAITLPHDDINIGFVFRENIERALGEHGLELSPGLIFPTLPTEQGGYEVAHKILALEDRPTAVVLSHESLTAGLYRGLTQGNYLPGKDIAVIGYGSAHSGFLSPALTAFHQQPRQIGVEVGAALLARMPAYKHLYPAGVVRKVWPFELVEGDSDAFVVTD